MKEQCCKEDLIIKRHLATGQGTCWDAYPDWSYVPAQFRTTLAKRVSSIVLWPSRESWDTAGIQKTPSWGSSSSSMLTWLQVSLGLRRGWSWVKVAGISISGSEQVHTIWCSGQEMKEKGWELERYPDIKSIYCFLQRTQFQFSEPTWQLIITCHSSFRRLNVLLWPLRMLGCP